MAMSVRYTNFGGELVAEDRGGVTSFYVPDNLGSTVALKNTSGTTTDSFTYWPYGEIRTRTGSTATPFTFVGNLGYYQVSTSRYYVRARDLRADQARWQTVDPLWPQESAYGYARSSPTRFIDPSGQDVLGDLFWLIFGRRFQRVPPPEGYTVAPVIAQLCHSPCKDCLDKVRNDIGNLFNGTRGQGNALRHCVGSCEANRQCGGSCAKAIYGHEIDRNNLINPLDGLVDVINNIIGAEFAGKGGSCEKQCRDALGKGILAVW